MILSVVGCIEIKHLCAPAETATIKPILMPGDESENRMCANNFLRNENYMVAAVYAMNIYVNMWIVLR